MIKLFVVLFCTLVASAEAQQVHMPGGHYMIVIKGKNLISKKELKKIDAAIVEIKNVCHEQKGDSSSARIGSGLGRVSAQDLCVSDVVQMDPFLKSLGVRFVMKRRPMMTPQQCDAVVAKGLPPAPLNDPNKGQLGWCYRKYSRRYFTVRPIGSEWKRIY